MKIKWLPNLISASRIIFAALYAHSFENELYPVALASLAAAGISDVADGAAARSLGACSRIGEVLDPVSDKILQCTVLVCLTSAGIIPAWSAIFYIIKEIILTAGGIVSIFTGRMPVASAWYGKAASATLFIMFVGLSTSVYFNFPPMVGIICGYVLCFVAVFSFTAYTVRFIFHLKTKAIIRKG